MGQIWPGSVCLNVSTRHETALHHGASNGKPIMAKASFSARLSAALKSYRTQGATILALMVEAVRFAEANSHNVMYCQKILDGMDGNDIRDAELIFTTLAPFVCKDGHLSVKKKDRTYSVSKADGFNGSFRTFAASLRLKDEDKAEKPFDLDAFALKVVARIEKENIGVEALEKALKAALIKAQQAKKLAKA